MTSEENNFLCRVDGDAPKGQLMRRHWIPALLSEEVMQLDGDPVRVRLFGEDLVAFRDSDGTVGLMDHGWKVNALGETALRKAFKGPFILAGGFDLSSANKALTEGHADLVAFGRPFLANPDLVARTQMNSALNPPDMSTLYTPGPKGYTDYPTLSS